MWKKESSTFKVESSKEDHNVSLAGNGRCQKHNVRRYFPLREARFYLLPFFSQFVFIQVPENI